MSKPDAPQPPDFTGAAQATGQSNITAAIINRLMGNVNSNTPWGSLRYTQTGTTHVGPGGVTLTGGMPSQPGSPSTFGASNPNIMHASSIPGLPDFRGVPSPVDPTVGGRLPGTQPNPTRLPGDSSGDISLVTGPPSSASSTGGLPVSGNFDIPSFTSDITLSPEQQAIFDAQQQNQQTSANKAGELLSGLDTSALDFSGMSNLPSGDQLGATRQSVQDALYKRQAQYLDPQFAQADEAERTRLQNQGFQVGTEGFTKAIGNFNDAKQKAYSDARDAAIAGGGAEMSRDYGMGLSSRQQAISEALTKRQLPLNLISALNSGGQVGMPQFPGVPGGQGIAGTDYLGASSAQNAANLQNYGIQAGQYNSQMGGLYGLLGTGALMYMMSDRRLKSGVRRIAEHPLGVGVYAYEIGGRPTIGVMADEIETVLPEAVLTMSNGLKAVNYGHQKICGNSSMNILP